MGILRSELGFSIASLFLTITIIFVTLPFAAYLLDNLSYSSHQETVSVEQFFLFLRDELIESESYKVNEKSISYRIENDDIGTISKYKNLIRRQVNKQGHEVYLRDIRDIQIKPSQYGIKVTLTTLKGKLYEKTIILPN